MPTSIESLTAEIRAFRDARDWRQFHNPKELAVAITAEAGELLQHFVWQSPEQSDQRVADRGDELASEMADIAILLFELADNCDVSLPEASLHPPWRKSGGFFRCRHEIIDRNQQTRH